MSEHGYRVGVLGATGAVGSTILAVLAERGFPASEVVALASERSAGKRVPFADGEIEVRAISDEAIQGLDIVLSSAGGAVSSEWAPSIVEAGAVVVDNTSFWRMHDDVPLVVSEVNPDAAEDHKGLIANPNCTTMEMVVALAPIQREVGIERLIVSTYQAVSGTGQRAIDELLGQSRAVLAGDAPVAEVYPHAIAFNVIPQVETFKDGDDYTTEERKVMAETRKIFALGDDEMRISATCARVPVDTGHSESVNVQTRRDLSPEECRELLAARSGRGRHGLAGRRDLPHRHRRRGPRRGLRRPDPARSVAQPLPQPVGGRQQPAEGCRHQRRPGRRAPRRARPGPRARAGRLASRSA